MAVDDPGIRLTTAPQERYEEIDLEGKARVRSAPPIVNDVEVEDWWGQETVVKKTIQRVYDIAIDDMTLATIDQLYRWKHNRTLLRINGNYGPYTEFYQCFQRSNPADVTDVGAQIGSATFARADSAALDAMYENDDGLLVPVATIGEARYEPSAYGMKGLLLEDQFSNLFQRSHAESGQLFWTVHTGSPTIVWSTTQQREKQFGQGGALHITMSNTEIIRASITFSGTTASAGVWLAGNGDIVLSLNETVPGSSVVATQAITLTPHWTLYTFAD
ncbi:MAG: hypothetical protein IH969_03335, partial [Candidatus Krumholzibacteriota bacterium]|nr:hypothetical protein [Candidatus Krumholzibacteriota bacterium]